MAGGWNPTAFGGANCVLVNGDRTAYKIVGTDTNIQTADTVVLSAQWYYAEMRMDANEFGDLSVHNLTDTAYVHVGNDGGVLSTNGGDLGAHPGLAYITGSTVRILFNQDWIYYAVEGGHWNDSPTANPATGVAGYANPIGAGNPAAIKAAMNFFSTSARTINTGTFPFRYGLSDCPPGTLAFAPSAAVSLDAGMRPFNDSPATTSDNGITTVLGGNAQILSRAWTDGALSYIEIKWISVGGGGVNYGFTDGVFNNWMIHDDTGGTANLQNGGFSQTAAVNGYVDGDTTLMAYNRTIGAYWCKVNTGNWNANASADPATGVGGIIFTAAGRMDYVGIFGSNSGTTIKVSLRSDSTYIGAKPTGYDYFLQAVSSGGTIFLQTVNIACAGSIAAAKGSAKHLAIACAGTISRTKQIAKHLAIACSGTVAAMKASAKHLAIACTGAVSVAKASAKHLTVACAGSVSSAKASAKHLAVACAGALSVATSSVRVFLQTVNIACTGSASVAKASAKHLAVACSGSVAAAKSTAKRVAVACAGSVAAVKNTTRHLAIACAGSITSSTARVFLQTINIAITGSAAVVKSTGKHLAVACSGSVAATKASAKSIAVACHGSVNAIKRTAKGIAISLSLTLSLLTVKLGPRAVLFRIVVLISAALARVGISTGGAQANVKTAASNTTITEAD